MPALKDAFAVLHNILYEYNGGEGNTLTKKQLVELLNSEFSDAPKDNPDIKELYNQLSGDCDGVVTFNDFINIVADFDKIHKNSSRVSQKMIEIKKSFESYARYEGDSETMTRRDLRFMIHREFPDAPKNSAAVTDLLSRLDTNGDGVIDFKEFLAVLADFYGTITNE